MARLAQLKGPERASSLLSIGHPSTSRGCSWEPVPVRECDEEPGTDATPLIGRASMHEDDVVEEQAQPEPTTVEAFTERGNARLRNGNLDTAIEDFGVAIRIDPTHLQALLGRGKAWHRKGEHVKAI